MNARWAVTSFTALLFGCASAPPHVCACKSRAAMVKPAPARTTTATSSESTVTPAPDTAEPAETSSRPATSAR